MPMISVKMLVEQEKENVNLGNTYDSFRVSLIEAYDYKRGVYWELEVNDLY
jgi:hypothetical protein